MVSQMIVRIMDKDAEHDPPEEFDAIVVSNCALGLQQIDQFQVACAGFAVDSLCESHRRHEGQSPALLHAIESPSQEGGVGALGYAQCAGVRNVNPGLTRKPIGNELPRAYVTPVLPAGELGKT